MSKILKTIQIICMYPNSILKTNAGVNELFNIYLHNRENRTGQNLIGKDL